MAAPALVLPDEKNKYEDLTGIKVQPGDNPYQALLTACDDDPSLYSTHRTLRNAQQRAKFLDPAFQEVLVDPYLLRIENPSIDPTFQDPRYGLVFWARPPEHILQLASHIQQVLKAASPNIWVMPLQRMHMTALEIVHSLTPEESKAVVDTTSPGIPGIVNYTYAHRARLVKPMISYDLAAVALSFVPAADEPHASPSPIPPVTEEEASPPSSYTYHHLRRDLFDKAKETGVEVASRYVVPSAHITLARFMDTKEYATPEARLAWVEALEALNEWLEKEVWDSVWADAEGKQALLPPHRRFVGEWVVGQERGLDARTGALWYGGGRSVMVGEGF
ncbi:ureidoglycolate hydrolase [Ophiostoma piceae UAMH 11346]|uniref:Ureidoglycolate hydrolase n=1 Tax=Ophiostoma piceae (strain UAMH 11346) TaxID=1262450 RepID=S3CP32_OPHP1|nr:ureidoglycolate hydrolase [Ophiostoma piceae UAMH 11346]